jgi:glycosyltransferase involved in cell wall biosynthesis
MRILFIADARSTISQGWIEHFVLRGDDIHVISSYPCESDAIAGAHIYQAPIAFSGLSRLGHNGTGPSGRRSRVTELLATMRIKAMSGVVSDVRSWLSPVEVSRHVRKIRNLITSIAPDLVHGLRIPFEGILAAKSTPARIPLMLSVWGNDFTLLAKGNPLIARQTRKALQRVDALLSDCERDQRLARRDWGLAAEKLSVVLPSSGGVRRSLFYPDRVPELRARLHIPEFAPVVINPRGFRGYVRQEVFFQAIPLVLKDYPGAIFVCSGMQSNPIAEKWTSELGIQNNVRLLPVSPHRAMADLFRLSDITVSPSEHDGTPNSLLEAMACGCFPVAGDLESVREWITDRENGLLCEPNDKKSIAGAISLALGDPQLRARAREVNTRLVIEQAEYDTVMAKAEDLYRQVLERRTSQE